MTLRSHTETEILAAFRRGTTIWALDSGTAGRDDILIGDNYCAIIRDVVEAEEHNVFKHDGWSISELGEGDEPLRSIIEEAEA